MALWRAAMSRLDGRVVGLDGVVARQADYARSGFVLEHRNLRYGGCVRDLPAAAHPGLERADRMPFDDLLAYDAAHFGRARPEFLRAWLALPESRGLALRGPDGTIRGFGVARRCGEGVKIGPLFAAGETEAETLFRALAAFAGDGPLFIDFPGPNAPAAALALRHGLAPVFETARMYRGPAPNLPLDRIYGISSFELG